ncbi:complex I 30 kDa subunit family protein [Francisella frigiditurris]|uniref:NADH-quinone oxidoreductase subunit C n=1 Tax=Francisella frigiditurris TaxID=1542390 RepID=A0A1J0KRH7_9GAMM|nr:NADH-quinone oxidoreductase subunit C [Francisella frigiditurris]APC96307.1 NADH dehydrogenase [Francisella frigiditurris]
MSNSLQTHLDNISNLFKGWAVSCYIANKEINISISDQRDIYLVLDALRKRYSFEQLTDITAVDYLTYGKADWDTGNVVSQAGFSRGRKQATRNADADDRFELIYQLLSFKKNVRIRVKCKLKNAQIILVDSVSDIWPSANWAEREVYDMFGIYFRNHPDLRRVLTDYGFVGHPLRKDFPQTGYVEMRYDENLGKVVYEPVEIDDRVNSPRVIRK